jgi:hypothetical protein
MRVQGTFEPFFYSQWSAEQFRVTVRVVERIIIFRKQSNIMNDVLQWTIIDTKDTGHMAR